MTTIFKTFFSNADGTMLENYFALREDAVKHLAKISGYDAPLTGTLPWVVDEGPYYATLTEIKVQ